MDLIVLFLGLVATAVFALIGWFVNRVFNKLDAVHLDIRSYSERLVTVETKMEIKCNHHAVTG